MDEIKLNGTDHLDFILGFIAHVNASLHNGTLNATQEADLVDSEVQDFSSSLKSLGLTSIIVISLACVLAFAGGCYCALKRTKRKATKIVSIRSIGSTSSQASLESVEEPPPPRKVVSPSPSLSQYHTPKSFEKPEPRILGPMMYNPVCPIVCTSVEQHANGSATVEGYAPHAGGGGGGGGGEDSGERGSSAIKITVSDSKIFGQSSSCSQFPDF